MCLYIYCLSGSQELSLTLLRNICLEYEETLDWEMVSYREDGIDTEHLADHE